MIALCGARPPYDLRPRVLAALTPEPSTAIKIAERWGFQVASTPCTQSALVREEADGVAVRSGTPQADWS
jgi:hypothetical protein